MSGATASRIRVVPVRTAAAQDAFLGLPGVMFPGEAALAPVTAGERARLRRGIERDREAWLLALDGKRPVGRLVVGLDPERRVRDGPLGLFAAPLFPADPAVGQALLATARELLEGWGAARLEGPSPRLYPGSGPLLLHGFDAPHAFGLAWSPESMVEQWHGLELGVGAEHYGYALRPTAGDVRRLLRWGGAARDAGLRVRIVRRRALGAELARARRFPYPEPHPVDIWHGARQLCHLSYRKGLVLRLARGRVPLGYALALPDLTPLLARFGGRLPTARGLRMLRFKREVEGARVLPPLLAPVGIAEELFQSARCLLVGSLLGTVLRAGLASVDFGPVPTRAEELRELLSVLRAKRDRIFTTMYGKVWG